MTIDRNVLFFDDLRYRTRQRETITVTNTGQVGATFRFVPKLEERHICKPWLSINPPFSMLLPGESIAVNVEAYIDTAIANGLNYGREALDDILVMRLENGRDHFISISGALLPSCFGTSIARLVCTPAPIRTARLENGQDGYQEQQGDGKALDAVLSVPKEIWRLVDAICNDSAGVGGGPERAGSGLQAVGLFVESGSAQEIAAVRECLDTGAPLERNVSAHSLAETLLQLLDSLADTVVPTTMWPPPRTDFDHNVAALGTWCSRFLNQLPTSNYNLFVYLVAFLRELLQHTAQNKLTAEQLSAVFARSMVRLPYTHSSASSTSAASGDGAADISGGIAGGGRFVGTSDRAHGLLDESGLQAARASMRRVLQHLLTAAEVR